MSLNKRNLLLQEGLLLHAVMAEMHHPRGPKHFSVFNAGTYFYI
jgi:hypothetical protein